jgi:tungstate transport system ATP-binding protein
MNLYSLEGVQQILGGRKVLDLEELAFEEGKGYALLGPNGSGKTTLLHILAFLSPPAHGRVFFRGKAVDWKEKALTPLRRRVVLVEQHPILFTDTVLKNVSYGPKMRGLSFSAQKKIAEESLELVGMGEFGPRPALYLSGGEVQRVALARALACQPEVLLFDEPTASVDVENARRIEALILKIRKERGISIIFSTHRRLEALLLADEQIFLSHGSKIMESHENIFSGTLVQRGERHFFLTEEGVEIAVHTDLCGPARLWIHPEKINLFSRKPSGFEPETSLFPGRVLRISAERGKMTVLVDMGLPLYVRISRERLAASGILPGDRVSLGFCKEAFSVEKKPESL